MIQPKIKISNEDFDEFERLSFELFNLANLSLIYSNEYIELEKKKKFEEIICALNEKSLSETELIAGTPEMVISSQASSNEVEGSSTIPEMVVEASASECSALNE